MKSQVIHYAQTSVSQHEIQNLAGKILIATPNVANQDMFNKSIIYIVSHDEYGCVGLIVNQNFKNSSFRDVFNMISSAPDNLDGLTNKYPTIEEDVLHNQPIDLYLGGPVEYEKAVILHTNDYESNIIKPLKNNLAISSNVDIIKDIAAGKGPENSLFIMGHINWAPGAIEDEIKNNLWIVSDFCKSLVFSKNNNLKWNIAIQRLGINPKGFFLNQAND